MEFNEHLATFQGKPPFVSLKHVSVPLTGGHISNDRLRQDVSDEERGVLLPLKSSDASSLQI